MYLDLLEKINLQSLKNHMLTINHIVGWNKLARLHV